MMVQDILFYVGIGLLVLGLALLAGAAYIFFSRNVLDIIADLNGTKRAEALEAMARENSRRTRRHGKSGEGSGSLNPTTGDLDRAPKPVKVDAPAEDEEEQKAVPDSQAVSDSAATTVMSDDSAATTVLAPDSADATTLLVSDEDEGDDAATAVMPEFKQEVEEEIIPDSFEIVRKIVLSESTEFVRPEQGANYA